MLYDISFPHIAKELSATKLDLLAPHTASLELSCFPNILLSSEEQPDKPNNARQSKNILKEFINFMF